MTTPRPGFRRRVGKRISDSLGDRPKWWIMHHLFRLLHGRDLPALTRAFGCDKEGPHHYAKHYQRHFESLRLKKINLLEIGVGGYKEPRVGGKSLRLWRAYFPKARIFGIDAYDKTYHDGRRIKTFQGDQGDPDFLRRVAAEIGPLHIIIDDGSHRNDHVTTAFQTLFPLMALDGIYAVEDLQTSYWDDFLGQKWGGSTDLSAAHTSMNLLKRLTDGLNHEEFPLADYTPTYFDRHVTSVHFYHNLAFVHKGLNDEGSNYVPKRP